MGVRTASFGPCSWEVLEVAANLFDQNTSRRPEEFARSKKHFNTVLTLMTVLLPCVHCREELKRLLFDGPPTTRLSQLAPEPDSGKRLVFNLHNAVNRKLGKEELDYDVAVLLRFRDGTLSGNFVRAFVWFIGYAVCDGDASGAGFQVVGKFVGALRSLEKIRFGRKKNLTTFLRVAERYFQHNVPRSATTEERPACLAEQLDQVLGCYTSIRKDFPSECVPIDINELKKSCVAAVVPGTPPDGQPTNQKKKKKNGRGGGRKGKRGTAWLKT